MAKLYIDFDEWRDFPEVHDQPGYGVIEIEVTESEYKLIKGAMDVIDSVVDLINKKAKEVCNG